MDFSLQHHQSYRGKHVSALPTPALVISLPVLVDNIQRLLVDVKDLGIAFRPHVKTLKCLEVTRMMLDGGKHNGIVASTVREIEGALPLVEEGILTECLYGLPITEFALNRFTILSQRLKILLMLDNEEQVDLLEKFVLKGHGPQSWDVFIKVDVGSRRAGLPSDSDALPSLIRRVEGSPSITLHGFYCHAGHSYGCRDRQSAEAILRDELDGVCQAAMLASTDRGPLVLSIGATPTAHSIKAIKATLPEQCTLELHAGNFPANDLQQVSTGLVDRSQQAVRVLADICSVYADRNEALANAGVIALSRETSAVPGFGEVVGYPDWNMIRLSQEHGIIGLAHNDGNGEKSKVQDYFRPGQRIAIYCQHACITAAAFHVYYVADENDVVVDTWWPTEEPSRATRRASKSDSPTLPVQEEVSQYNNLPLDDYSSSEYPVLPTRETPASSTDIGLSPDSPEPDSSMPSDELATQPLELVVCSQQSHLPGSSALSSLFRTRRSPLGQIPPQPSLFPQLDPNRFALFGHYIQATANSMANGAAPSNPFLVLLLPLAMSSDLVLNTILAQSSAHRANIVLEENTAEGTMLYNTSLRLIRNVIGSIMRQENVDTLSAVVGVLIMCFTETAKGDANGAIFDHLLAAGSLLPKVLEQLNHDLYESLRDFLVEYFIYTATTSMVSMDAQFGQQTILSPELMLKGYQLVDSGYIGNLSGCWLKLLLFMPSILELARQWLSEDSSDPSADMVIQFSTLHMQISQWEPPHTVSSDTALAGRIYQQATLLYLLTALGGPSQDPCSVHSLTMRSTLNTALQYLEQLDPSNQINTSLCWPIAVVGSCVTCPFQQASLHSRLDDMATAIGLGNMTRTREILDFMWLHNLVGPWEISKAMQAAELWISFA
ncbi:transcription factor domain-containing protein [Aspergillus stella-maris]|uniref:transcription factor domain-containing protein n=1 Tax=Aspergillus stella-maris TaxID=1810926 RepID=UPI003CCCFBC4